ncbi:MAG: L-aspartate oxidase [Candidatus Microbacterium phytovorans]|uniref:L-aspartate oxidase n=1 Tax=Candidatus Microbacterium phytovorans TaxID=3121374 RepID=A0AAJ5W5P7_9MICO|nr:L-aspartate oxidase [Microbacterium sp.]WEK14715.1 MAG: L-aspartate oxidase [Microbacterium sp.]
MTEGQVHVVVVGSGIAGLTAARHALDDGCRVTLVTKSSLPESNTRYAQGGIAGVMFDEDDVADHARDTLTAGAGLSDADAVDVLVGEGPDRIRDLIDLGVAFDRDESGDLRRGLEAAHSFPRVLHAGGDATGAAIEDALVRQVRRSDAVVLEHTLLLDLVVRDGVVCGVDVLRDDSAGGERTRLSADAVVLATGGAGQLFAHTTNPTVATGDGIAAALRAGADVRDLEFFQFHPTVLPADGEHASFLVSEAVRGEGAVLRDAAGHRFMPDVHPDAELAPRDVVARAIALQMARHGGRPVQLDATALGAPTTSAFLADRFPTIDRTVRERGWDWSRRSIPVTPAAHYLMGGITTDLSGRSTLPRLYAAGETARTGAHGANRLASNSLLEGAVFGARVGGAIRADVGRGDWPVRPTASAPWLPDVAPSSPASPFSRAALQDLLWTHAGLVRDRAGLTAAASVLSAWSAESRPEVTAAEVEDANLLLVARHLVAAALARRDSVGAHYRSDAVGVDAVGVTAASPASQASHTIDHRVALSSGTSARRGAADGSRKVPA